MAENSKALSTEEKAARWDEIATPIKCPGCEGTGVGESMGGTKRLCTGCGGVGKRYKNGLDSLFKLNDAERHIASLRRWFIVENTSDQRFDCRCNADTEFGIWAKSFENVSHRDDCPWHGGSDLGANVLAEIEALEESALNWVYVRDALGFKDGTDKRNEVTWKAVVEAVEKGG